MVSAFKSNMASARSTIFKIVFYNFIFYYSYIIFIIYFFIHERVAFFLISSFLISSLLGFVDDKHCLDTNCLHSSLILPLKLNESLHETE